MPGPVPKRSDQRVRRNKDEAGTITKIEAPTAVEVPELDIIAAHPMVVDFWAALTESAQKQYFEPTDWQYARFTLWIMNDMLTSGNTSAMKFQAIQSALSDLLVSEGARRRVRIEIKRGVTEAKVMDVAEMFRQRQTAAQGS
jgi:hypothetical protein